MCGGARRLISKRSLYHDAMAMLVPHEDHIGCIYIRVSFMIEVLQIKSSHFILGVG